MQLAHQPCPRLTSSGDLPDVAGQPAQALVHVTLDQLRDLPGAVAAQAGWMSSRAAQAYACDARLTPIVPATSIPPPWPPWPATSWLPPAWPPTARRVPPRPAPVCTAPRRARRR